MNEYTADQKARYESAQDELHAVLERYEMTIGVDVVSYDRPVLFLVCNEDVDRPRLH